MKVYVGADHRGFDKKNDLVTFLKKSGYTVADEGDKELDPNDDFPQFAAKVVTKVLSSDDPEAMGVLLCGSGQGMCIAANRYKGIRAALGYDKKSVRLARNDDNSNVLCLPADDLAKDELEKIVDLWLKTPFADATRFKRRIAEIDELN